VSDIPGDGFHRLMGTVQNYAWGGYHFIPTLLGVPPKPGVTYAEYWMGAHEEAPSHIVRDDGTTIPIDEMIEAMPERTLGVHVAQRYGRLPYLFKVLDVREMLSIQVHPTKSEAELGFAKENEMGIPLGAPERNYKDTNHKPELQAALSDFWLLHGFQPIDQLHRVLNETQELRPLDPILQKGGYVGLYRYVMEMPQHQVDSILGPLAHRVLHMYECGELEEASHDYWASKALQGRQREHYDRGLFSIYFFNIVRLRPGQAIYQGAGVPHALLQGQALEIMASSDNTVRGGLTVKHVDVPELLRLIAFRGVTSNIIESSRSDQPCETSYHTPSSEFCLSRIVLSKGDIYENTTYSIEIMLILRGEVTIEALGRKMLLKRGESTIIFAGKTYRISAVSEEALLFKASVPRSIQAA
jgi:mannose-6-phosphate isomerase